MVYRALHSPARDLRGSRFAIGTGCIPASSHEEKRRAACLDPSVEPSAASSAVLIDIAGLFGSAIAIWVQFAPVSKLITAEGTVEDRAASQSKHPTQRVRREAVDPVRPGAYFQIAVMTNRALTPVLKNSEGRPIEVRVRAAVIAVKRGF